MISIAVPNASNCGGAQRESKVCGLDYFASQFVRVFGFTFSPYPQCATFDSTYDEDDTHNG
jgi:hypothetical protein